MIAAGYPNAAEWIRKVDPPEIKQVGNINCYEIVFWANGDPKNTARVDVDFYGSKDEPNVAWLHQSTGVTGWHFNDNKTAVLVR